MICFVCRLFSRNNFLQRIKSSFLIRLNNPTFETTKLFPKSVLIGFFFVKDFRHSEIIWMWMNEQYNLGSLKYVAENFLIFLVAYLSRRFWKIRVRVCVRAIVYTPSCITKNDKQQHRNGDGYYGAYKIGFYWILEILWAFEITCAL